jgi:hypothetical protein
MFLQIVWMRDIAWDLHQITQADMENSATFLRNA